MFANFPHFGLPSTHETNDRVSWICLVGDFLRIVPLDSSSFFTTIWENMFGTFSKHRTSKSKVCDVQRAKFWVFVKYHSFFGGLQMMGFNVSTFFLGMGHVANPESPVESLHGKSLRIQSVRKGIGRSNCILRMVLELLILEKGLDASERSRFVSTYIYI